LSHWSDHFAGVGWAREHEASPLKLKQTVTSLFLCPPHQIVV